MSPVIVIPARGGSTRFPRKPMHSILGIPMLERVWRIANRVTGPANIIVATDDDGIAAFARSFGAQAVMTSPACRNGTERVFEAVINAQIRADLIINLQGDALLTPPWILSALIDELQVNPNVSVATPAVRLSGERLTEFEQHKLTNKDSGTTVVFNNRQSAMYFSKNVLPYMRNKGFSNVYRHIGLYGYRMDALERYSKLDPSPLELTEGLEQMRFLENGLEVHIVEVDYKGRTHASIDNPGDVDFAEKIIRREGELF